MSISKHQTTIRNVKGPNSMQTARCSCLYYYNGTNNKIGFFFSSSLLLLLKEKNKIMFDLLMCSATHLHTLFYSQTCNAPNAVKWSDSECYRKHKSSRLRNQWTKLYNYDFGVSAPNTRIHSTDRYNGSNMRCRWNASTKKQFEKYKNTRSNCESEKSLFNPHR